MLPDVLVENRRRECDELLSAFETKEARAVRQVDERRDPLRERAIRDAPAHELAVLRAEAERDLVAGHGDVSLAKRGDAVRSRAARVPLGPDAKPGLVHDADSQRAGPLLLIGAEAEVAARAPAQARQAVAEVEQPLVLRALLGRPEGVVV